MQSLEVLEPALDTELALKAREDRGDIGNITLQLRDTTESFDEMKGVLILLESQVRTLCRSHGDPP